MRNGWCIVKFLLFIHFFADGFVFRFLLTFVFFFFFYGDSKTYIKLTKTRLLNIKKRRSAVEKYLKDDIAELLRSGYDTNAYGKVILLKRNWLLT